MKLRAIVSLAAAAIGLSLSQAALAECPVPGNTATPFFAGPVNPVNGFAEFVEDSTPLALELCLAGDGATGPCFFDPVIPGNLYSQQIGFGAEGFWWLADVAIADPNGINASLVFAAEAAWAAEIPELGQNFPFTRLRVRLDVPEPGTYTVDHPYGSHTFDVPVVGAGDEVREVFDIPFVPGPLPGQSNQGCVGPWLVSTDFPAAIAGFPGTFIGDGTPRTTTTGDIVSVNGLTALGTVSASTDLFTIFGKVWDGQLNTPVVADRASFDRPTLGLQAGQVDAFATSVATADATAATAVRLAGGPNLPGENLALAGPDTLGRFFRSQVLADASVLPPFVEITATGAGTDPTRLLRPLTDVVTISRAEYSLETGTLGIEATSSDGSTAPTLTLADFGVTLPAVVATAAPPATITVVSANGGSDTEPVTVVASFNLSPIALADSATTDADTPVTIAVLGNDNDPDNNLPLLVANLTQPANGTAAVNALDQSVTYTPAAGFTGPDTFTYQAEDARGALSNVATVTVTVRAANVAPVANPDTATTNEDTPVSIPLATLLANDTDENGDALTVTAVGGALNGTVSIVGANARFVPAPLNFNGAASFDYTISDGRGGSATATVTVTVNAVNDAPVANPDGPFTTAEDTALTINDAELLANDTDVEGDVLVVAVVNVQGLVGTLSRAGGVSTYTPPLNFSGTTSFTYQARDPSGALSNFARVTITVTPVNDAPVAVNDTATTTAGTPVTISVLANDTDVDGDALSVANVASVVGGTAAVNANNTVTFTPAAGVTSGSFTYQARDPSGALSNVATVSVAVNAVAVDLDIARFTATNAVRLSRGQQVALSLNVRNNSAVNAPGTATLIGTQNGGQVYNQTITVSDPPGGGATTFAFPSYAPGATGNITWVVTIADGNPDIDQATRTTNVRP